MAIQGDAASVAPTSTMASAMMFGAIMFATVALATRAYLSGDRLLFDKAANPRSTALDIKSLSSVYTLLFHSSLMGLILLYAYICEYHPPHPHADKHYDADQFFFLTFLLFVVSFFTWKRHDNSDYNKTGQKAVEDGESTPNKAILPAGVKTVAEANDLTEILNRDQTEEWKGWMQFMFLLYHYFHAEDVYNAIRIMITCYVWMTGFGNFSFFYLKGDFSAVRVLQMLWRLNFLVLFLCLTQGTTYILYYICLLHTYYFLMVYVTLRIGCEKNYTKWWIRIKMGVLALAIFLIWDCDSGLFKMLHFPFFGEEAKMGATAGSMWEWYFRTSLDHWSTFLGMIFALNFPITSLFYRKLEAQPLYLEILAKGATGAALFGVFYYWVTGPFMQGKFDYNQTNSYFGIIPLITYIYFRNLTPWLRNHTLELLHQIGKTTLETYLMQHHIWLTSDAKSLLTLIPGWPKVNFLLVSLIYVFLSRRLYQLTLFLRGMVLPDNKSACIRNLTGMGGMILFFCGLAWILDSQGMLSLQAVCIIAVACGYLLYQFVLDLTVGDMTGDADSAVPSGGQARLVVPYMFGFVAVLCLGLSWNTMAVNGASKILPLPETCAEHANEGAWMTLDGCDDGPAGAEYRSFDISQSTCSAQNAVSVWGWKNSPSSAYCRFKQRDPKKLKAHLRRRTIYFAGDSVTRYVYHSFCRQLGVVDAGAYNATEKKHNDISRQIGDMEVDFLWAGFATDLVEKIDEMAKFPRNPAKGEKKSPDLVVLGGGAWDKLWRYSTDKEKEELQQAYNAVAKKIKTLQARGVSVVWISPTTINSAALIDSGNSLKRENINEKEMELIRTLHEREGLHSAVDFVLDGESFTSSRVQESFDGVHYPHHVYSAGAQILANAVDWLLPEPLEVPPKDPPQPGAMAHVPLGMMMLCLAFFGIVGFDGFMGFSYLAAIFVPDVAPFRLFYESFSVLHRKKNLPSLDKQETLSLSGSADSSDPIDEEEASGLLSKDS